jgi:threonine dehydrogenase-like Zn-dependent dehydrogenase
MRQSYWEDDGIKLREVEPGPLAEGWVRLKVAACGICGSDLHRLKGPPTPGRFGTGNTPGHELVGTVLESHKPLPDALYAVEPWLACGTCDFCALGKTEHCRNGRLIGAQVAGGLADFIDVPERNLHPADASLTPREASLNEPFGICTRSIHLAELKMDSRVMVLGGGTLGLICGTLARDYAGKVAITARYPHQADAARKLGFEPVAEPDADAFAKEFEPDVVIESVGGHADTIDQAMRAVRPGGRIVVQGLFSHKPEFDARALIMKEIRIVGSKFFGMSEHGPVFRAASRFLPRYRDEIRTLQTHQFPLSDIKGAFATALDKTAGAIKITVVPDSA